MPTKLLAHEQPISRIFSNDYVFRIPGYQRPYAWTTDQARDLYEDLIGFMSTKPGDVEDMPPYFLGSIVLIKSETSPNADVVDGQQRLTTLTLLLSAIRSNVNATAGADITQLIYERGSQILGTQDRFRLSLRDRDQEFFQRYAQLEGGFSDLLQLGDALPDSQRNIRDNARLFDSRIRGLPDVDRLRLAQFTVTRCFLVVVATPDIESAYRIFSVLNTRGLDLSATDILKAEIIGGMAKGQRDAYTKKWEDVEEDLGRDAFGDLFSHIRMVYRKAKPQGTLLGEFKEHVLKGLAPAQFVDEVLVPMAAVYEELTDIAYESSSGAERVNEHLKWLNRLEHNDWMPPALAFAVRRRNQPDATGVFFGDLERLAYSLLLSKAGINERIERFSRLTKAIESEEDLQAAGSPLQLTPQEQYVAYDVLAGPIYNTLSARARTAVLLRLDALLSAGGATYDFPTVTVEHVLPQNPDPDSQWSIWFPDLLVRADCVHMLGNLALLTRKKNSSANNYDYDRKKLLYFTRNGVSPFALTTQVIEHLEWTPEVIKRRQTTLLALLEEHWRLQHRDGSSIRRSGLGEGSAERYSDGTWRDDVFEALRQLGGRASLDQIYQEVERIRREMQRSVPRTLDAIVRRTLEENSSDSDSFKGGPDLFIMPVGRGAGVWALRQRDVR